MKQSKNQQKKLIRMIVISLIVVGYVTFVEFRVNYMNQTVCRLSNSIDTTTDIISSLITNILNNTEIVKNIEKNLTNTVDKRLGKQRLDKIKVEKTLQQVNVEIINNTMQTQGSGVSIKYKDKFYILTAGHMAENENDELYLYENNEQICKLEIVKHDFKGDVSSTLNNDLLLLRPINNKIIPRYYVEIIESEPITSTQIYIVGNPMGIEDVLSDGRVIGYKDNFMYYIDHTYFGNSGGGVFTQDGVLVGIVSHMVNLKPMEGAPDYLVHGAVRLNTIIEFLKDVI
jgi:S1-C subfamily serine protease